MNRVLLYQSVRNGLKVFFPEHAMPTRNCIDVACAVQSEPAGPTLTQQVLALFPKYAGVGGLWDFTDTATMVNGDEELITTVGEAVAAVIDLTGQETHLFQEEAASRLLYNGNGITPDGVDDFMVSVSPLDLTACDKVVTAMGVEKINNDSMTQMQHGVFPSNTGRFSKGLGFLTGNTSSVIAAGTANSSASIQAFFNPRLGNEYGAHISRHSIPGALSQVWWNEREGTPGTGNKGTGNFDLDSLRVFSAESNTPTRRALVMGIPVAQPQMSDEDIELIRLWLMEAA